MASRASITATLNLDTGQWTRELTKGKEQLRAFQNGIAAIKLKPLAMPEIQRPANNGGFGRFEHMQGQWENFRKSSAGMGEAGRAASGAMQQTSKGATNAGMAMLMLSQGFDDIQYGFRSIVNNIAPLVMALGGSAGLAGGLTIAAVGVNQLSKMWDRLNGSMALAKHNAEALKQAQERLASGVAAAADSGQEAGDFNMQKVERTDAGRASQDRVNARGERMLELQKELQRVEASRLEGSARLKKELEIESDAERKALETRLKTAQERLDSDSASLGAVTKDLAASKKELEALEARDAAAKRQHEMDKNAEDSEITLKEGRRRKDFAGKVFSQLEEMVGFDPFAADRKVGEYAGLSKAEQERMAFLKNRIPGVSKTRDELDKRAGAGLQAVDDIKAAKEEQKLREEAARKEIEYAEVKERAERNSKAVRATFDVLDRWVSDVREIGELMAKQAAEQKAKAAKRQTTDEDAEIAHARARGHHAQADRLERRATRRRRVKQLMDDEDRSPQAAEAQARTEERDKRGTSGQKFERGPANPTGLDAFDFRQRGQRPETPNVEETRRANTRRFRDKEPADAGGGGIGALVSVFKEVGSTLAQKLEELKAAQNPAVADKIKPSN